MPAVLTTAIKRVIEVWIGRCSVARQVVLEIRDEHGPGLRRVESR